VGRAAPATCMQADVASAMSASAPTVREPSNLPPAPDYTPDVSAPAHTQATGPWVGGWFVRVEAGFAGAMAAVNTFCRVSPRNMDGVRTLIKVSISVMKCERGAMARMMGEPCCHRAGLPQDVSSPALTLQAPACSGGSSPQALQSASAMWHISVQGCPCMSSRRCRVARAALDPDHTS